MARKVNFIKAAIRHPGSFTRSAKKAGMSVGAYAQKEKGASGVTGKRARLAITLRRLAQRRKR